MKVKLTVEYDGGGYAGWQFQPGLRTVQGELEGALAVYLASLAKKFGVDLPGGAAVVGSGRTDSGVHARGQVASFPWPEGLQFDGRRLVAALNGITAADLVVLSAEEVDDSFDARLTPHIKCYSYSLALREQKGGLNGRRSWSVGTGLDLEKMIIAAKFVAGRRDFANFRAGDCSAKTTTRTILSSELVRADAEILRYIIQGKGFLKQMVRILVGTMVAVGQGRMELNEFFALFDSPSRREAGRTAPAYGLVLEWVDYSRADIYPF